MLIRGVLFDLDGVIQKSMDQHLKAWQYAFNKFNVSVKPQHFLQLEGRGVKAVVEELTKRYRIDPALNPRIMKTKIDYYKEHLKVELYPGLRRLLNFLKEQQLSIAVVTGGHRSRVQPVIDNHLSGFFDTIVTEDDVQNTKPFPEPYLTAAKIIDIPAGSCVVIENAPLGIRAARQAGMCVIAVETTLDREYLQEANYIADDLNGVKKILEYLLKRS